MKNKTSYKEETLEWANNLIEGWLRPKPRIRVLKEGEADIPDNVKIYPSSLGSCLRMLWYEKNIPRPKPYRPDWELMAKLGTGFHKVIGKLFAYEEVRREKIGDTDYYLCSYPDGIQIFADDSPQSGLPTLLLEFKTRDSLNVYRKDIIQVGATAILWPIAQHALIAVFLRSPRGEELYKFEYLSPRQLTNAKKLAETRIKVLTDSLSGAILPIAEINRGCDGCAWKSECMLDSNEEVI